MRKYMAQSSIKKYGQSNFIGSIKSNKKTVACYLGFVALMILQALYCSYSLMDAGSTRVGLVYIFALGLVLIALLTYAFKTERLKQSAIYLICLLTLGVLFIFLFAPLAAPDERVHYQASYWYSNYILGYWQNELPVRAADVEFFNNPMSFLTFDKQGKISVFESNFSNNYSLSNFNEVYIISNINNNPIQTYFLSAIGISLGRILELNPIITYYLAKIFNFLGYAACAYVAFRNTPIGKPVFAILSMFPLALELATSLSYDGMTMGIAMVLTAFCFKAIFVKGKQQRSTLIVIFVFAILITPCKIVYSTVILLVLLIPNSTFRDRRFSLIYKYAILLACTIVFGFTKLGIAATVASSTTTGTTHEEWKSYSLGDFVKNPLLCLKIYFFTFFQLTSCRISQFSNSALGALDIETHNNFVFSILYLFLFVVSLLKVSEKKIESWFALKTLCFASFVITYLLIDASMLFAWTIFGSEVILGVQGRYYYPAVFLLIPVFLNTRFSSNTIGTDKLIICSAGTSILYAMDIYTLVMTAV